jgi:ATP-grasp domain, R2K clade family 3
MQPILLFRMEFAFQHELRVARKHFPVVGQRCACPPGSLVVGRYSVLPFYNELERDLEILGSRLVNTGAQHRWIANFEYYRDLKQFSAESWDESNFHLCDWRGPFVVKDRLSSQKHRWKNRMFAKTKRRATEIGRELAEDAQIRDQGIIYRRYVPLVTYEVGLHGLRYTNEWRVFYLGDRRLSHGYYWSLAENAAERKLAPEGLDFADRVAMIAAQHTRFFTLDIAEKEAGGWLLIEINDGQMAALSDNDPDALYSNLKSALHDSVIPC